MAYWIVTYSKYGIVLFLMLFVVCGFYSMRYEDVWLQGRTATLQSVFLFLTQFLAYLTIVLRTQRIEYLLFYAVLQILTLALPLITSILYEGISRILYNHMCMLLSAGLILLTRLDLGKAARQLLIASAAFVLGLIVPWAMKKIANPERFGWICAGIGILALGAVLVLGQVTHGSRISWTIGGVTFQPSEFVKILYVCFLAAVFSGEIHIGKVVCSALAAGAHVLILVLSRDLGSALIFFAVYVMMLTVATHRLWYPLAGLILGAGASVLAYRLFSHVRVRVQAWRDPWSVIDDQGYQITQSLFAISRGGLFGLGIGKGTPQDIPYVETDFIFAAMAEEMGLLFCIGIILTGIALFWMVIRLAAGRKEGFYRNLSAGFGLLYAFQMFLTVGGGTRFIPLTGVTLPLISYGGSSVMTTILMFSMIQGMYQQRYEEEIRLEKERRNKARREAKKREEENPDQ